MALLIVLSFLYTVGLFRKIAAFFLWYGMTSLLSQLPLVRVAFRGLSWMVVTGIYLGSFRRAMEFGEQEKSLLDDA